jgi:membrane-associated phospholipid phosphatase
MNSSPATTWLRFQGRLQAELKLKLFLTVLLNLWFYVPYALLQRHSLFVPSQAPQTHLDLLIPFSDNAVWLYLSLFLLMPIGPLLMCRREQLLRYGVAIFLIESVAYVVFLLYPTWCPRPDASGTVTAYRTLTTVDFPLNAFPSLHAAFAVFSALCAALVLRELRVPPAWRLAVGVWSVLILLGTLLTKQHTVLDISAGGAIGLVVYHLVFSRRTPAFKMKTSASVNAREIQSNSTAI